MIQALREILAVFKVDTKDLDKGVKNSNKAVDGLGDMLRGLAAPLAAAFSGAAVVGFAHELVTTASAARDTADALGLGVRELQEWQHAASLSNIATEQVTTSITKLGQKIAQAKAGNSEMAKTFKALGVDVDEVSKIAEQSLGDAFEHVGLALAGLEDNAQRTDLAMKLFEESGPKLFNLFKDGAEGIEAMRKEVEELGFAFDDEFADGSKEVTKNLTRLSMAGKGLLLQVLKPLLPDLLDLSKDLIRGAKAVMPLVKQFVTFAKETGLVQKSVQLLASGALAIGIANFGKLAGVIRSATVAAAKFLIPALLIEDLIVFLAGGKSLIGRKLDDFFGAGTADKVRESIKEMATAVYEFFGRVKDEIIPIIEEWGPTVLKLVASLGAAVVAFKLVTGAITLWSGVMAGIPTIMKAARTAWLLFQVALFANPIALVAAAIVGALALVVAYWPEISGFFSDLWEKVGGGLTVIEFLEGAWIDLKFAAIGAATGISDAFGEAWNFIIAGAQRALKFVAGLMEKLPFIGEAAAKGLSDLAGSAGDLTMRTDRFEGTAKEWQEARAGLRAEVDGRKAQEAASDAEVKQYYASPSRENFTSVSQDINQTTQVTVTVPPGTPESVANRVGAAAERGAREGSGRNRRAIEAAVGQRPATG